MKDRLFILAMFAAVIFALPLFTSGKKDDIAAPAVSAPDIAFPETLNIYLTDSNSVVTVTAEEYLVGCICAQIAINYEPEALKAQAAASATYAMRLMSSLKGTDKLPAGADISDDKRVCQPYYTAEMREEYYGEDYEKYRENVEAAARYGVSHIITYEGEPIYAVYHSVSAGRTCPSEYIWSAELPYLRRAESEWDKSYINFECVNEMLEQDAWSALVQYDEDIRIPADCSKWFSEMNTNEEGYVISVKIGDNTFTGGDIWRIFGLRSPAFTVSYRNGIFTFTTKGLGHGAGLSQYGANEMAKSGSSAEQILLHYYGSAVSI